MSYIDNRVERIHAQIYQDEEYDKLLRACAVELSDEEHRILHEDDDSVGLALAL